MKRYFDFDMNDYKDKKCNFHSHTVRCQHAVGEEREYVEEAIKEGFEVIGFSDPLQICAHRSFVATHSV